MAGEGATGLGLPVPGGGPLTAELHVKWGLRPHDHPKQAPQRDSPHCRLQPLPGRNSYAKLVSSSHTCLNSEDPNGQSPPTQESFYTEGRSGEPSR